MIEINEIFRELKNVPILLKIVCDTEKCIKVVKEGFHDNLLQSNFLPLSYLWSLYKFFGFNSIQCHPLFNHNLQYIEKLKTKKCDNLDKKLKKEFGLIILQAKS